MANNIIVRKCRRCGRKFNQRAKPTTNHISCSSEAYVLHRFCPSCRWQNARAARECDPRFATVGGHGTDFPETPSILRTRAAREDQRA